MDLHFILDDIKATLEEDGYVNTLEAPELRKYEWEKDLKSVTVLMNHRMTEMYIKIFDPSLI